MRAHKLPRVNRRLGRIYRVPTRVLTAPRVPADIARKVDLDTSHIRHVAEQVAAAMWMVDGVFYDEHGFATCGMCMEATGSPFCRHTKDVVEAVASYERQLSRVRGRRELTPAEIVRRSPVNRKAAA